MESRPCPVCGTPATAPATVEARADPAALDSFAFAARKIPEYMHHRLVECPRCELLYADPAPSEGAVLAAYAEADYDTAEESSYAAATYAKLLRRLLPRLPTEGGALDIGAGDGAFVRELLDAGVSGAMGVEPSPAPISTADPDVAARIRQGAFRPEDFEPASMRLVTCFQTIEHVRDPLDLCRGALELLRPGGALMIICHDRRAPVNRALGTRSPIYDLEHLQLFSSTSLHALYEEAGFRGIESRRIVNRYALRYWARLFPLPRPVKVQLLRALAGAVGAVPVTLPVGNLAAVGYRTG